jgi:hypothetical protein
MNAIRFMCLLVPNVKELRRRWRRPAWQTWKTCFIKSNVGFTTSAHARERFRSWLQRFVRWFVWQHVRRRTRVRENHRSHKKMILSREDVSVLCSTADSRRIMKATTMNPIRQPSAPHQRSRSTQANTPTKKISRMDKRQHRDHRARQDGNQPVCGRASGVCDRAII